MNLQEISSISAYLKTELQPIFEKIGKGAEWVWQIAYRQQLADVVTALVICLPLGYGFIRLAKFLNKRMKKCDYDKGVFRAGIVLSILTAFFLIILSVTFAIRFAINPEYYTLFKVVNLIKGSTEVIK